MDKFIRLSKKIGPIFAVFCLVGYLIPKTKKLNKYRNAILTTRAYLQGNTKLTTSPATVRIAPTALCNYRCLFCEIHKDNVLYPKRSKNEITLEHIKNYEGVLENAYNLSFYGGSEEPLIAKEFGDIIKYMKINYGTKLMVNTNASLMKGKTLDAMVEYGFDYIIVSYHAGTEDGYKAIMTGKIDKVDKNLEALRDKKKELGKKKPVTAYNFALQRLNSDEYEAIFDKAKKHEAGHVIVNRYYGGRNKLQDKKVSYEFAIEEGNGVLDDIYAYGSKANVDILPKQPEYWEQPAEDVIWDDEDVDESIQCHLPWSHLHFNPVLDRANSHFVGVCNRAELFKIDYARLDLSTKEKADKIWNHSLLKHLRETVNEGCDTTNPLCRFCKNNQREAMRNVDADKYADKRDTALEAFFKEYREKYTPEEIEGLTIMTDNPHSDKDFQEKLGELKQLEIAEKRQLDTALEEQALDKIA